MIRLDRDAIYTRQDLIELLAAVGIDADFFISRIKPKKVFRAVWLGADLLDALASAPPLAEREPTTLSAPANQGNRRRRTQSGDPLDPLKQLMKRDDHGLSR